MSDLQTRLEDMLRQLRKHHFRITPQRLAVLRVLARSREHPSVEHIYQGVKKDFPTTSLATVYKTVNLLKELNEVLEFGFPEGSNRYDGRRPFSHPHLICIKCNKIVDADLDSLRVMTQELVAETGYQIISHRLDFFGICPDCRERGED